MLLHDGQKTVARDTHRFRVCCNGRRWGKTTLAIEEIKGKALSKESRIAYIAPTYQQARDIAWDMLKSELTSIIEKVNESRLELAVKNIKGTESIIKLRGWESIETLRGQQFDFIVIDEIASMRNYLIHWEEVVRPTLTDTRGEGLFISTPKGFNHFYDLYNKESESKDYKSFHYTTYDNPYIPKDEINIAKAEMEENRFAQEYMADFRKSEGLVYKEFDRFRHLMDIDQIENKRIIKVICGVDFGYNNPTAILKIGIDHDNNYYVMDEWYKSRQDIEQIVEKISSYDPSKVYPDPAEPDRIAKIKKHFHVMEVSKDIKAGIDSVNSLLKQNRLIIAKHCVNLITELESYRYADKKPDKNEEELPVKENDHAVDALRYAIHNTRSVDVMRRPTRILPKTTYKREL